MTSFFKIKKPIAAETVLQVAVIGAAAIAIVAAALFLIVLPADAPPPSGTHICTFTRLPTQRPDGSAFRLLPLGLISMSRTHHGSV